MGSLAERLYYETVIAELGDSAEVLYVSVANAALAHLPYLIALDHHTRWAGFPSRVCTGVSPRPCLPAQPAHMCQFSGRQEPQPLKGMEGCMRGFMQRHDRLHADLPSLVRQIMGCMRMLPALCGLHRAAYASHAQRLRAVHAVHLPAGRWCWRCAGPPP